MPTNSTSVQSNIVAETEVRKVEDKAVETSVDVAKTKTETSDTNVDAVKEETVVSNVVPSVATSVMKVTFIDVGQADCILIESSGHYMLVDAGNDEDASVITTYLKNQEVEKLDFVIGTHPHEDHIGSLYSVIDTFDIDTVIMPEVTTTTQAFESVLTSIENKGLSITKPEVGTTYNIGDASFTIIAPNGSYGDEYNNWSVGIKFTNGNNSFVMCGDAEIEAEYDITSNGIDISADVLKIGYHGSATATSEAMLKAVNPTFAVISVGTGNSYGHPTEETLNRLNDTGVQIFRTDEQGNIIATSDGENMTWSCAPSTSMVAGVQNESSTTNSSANSSANTDASSTSVAAASAVTENTQDTTVVEQTNEIVANTDTTSVEVHITDTGSKYHRAGCQYLKKSDTITTLDNAKALGLEPCSKCNPPQ
jgi:competence protein ComEC